METTTTGAEWDVYLLAGIASSPAVFAACERELGKRFRAAGRHPAIRALLPYGDHTAKMWRQIVEVGADLTRLSRLRASWHSGGRRAAEQIRRHSPGRRVLLVGHSGGGVAAYYAAVVLLHEQAIADFRVVQIGSPKVPVRPAFRDKVSCFAAVDEDDVPRDPIVRLGSWSGWSRHPRGYLYWNRMKYAPGRIGTIRLLGGHEHYFREEAPYVHPVHGSNLLRTLDAIWDLLT